MAIIGPIAIAVIDDDQLTVAGGRFRPGDDTVGSGKDGGTGPCRITSYNVCYTKLLRVVEAGEALGIAGGRIAEAADLGLVGEEQTEHAADAGGGERRITSYNVCYTKLLRFAGL